MTGHPERPAQPGQPPEHGKVPEDGAAAPLPRRIPRQSSPWLSRPGFPARPAEAPGTRPASVPRPRLAGKPTPAELGLDITALEWQRSGGGDGCLEVAFPVRTTTGPAAWARGEWVLMRLAGDPDGRVLVFDRNEWECFLDGARNGEFDDDAAV